MLVLDVARPPLIHIPIRRQWVRKSGVANLPAVDTVHGGQGICDGVCGTELVNGLLAEFGAAGCQGWSPPVVVEDDPSAKQHERGGKPQHYFCRGVQITVQSKHRNGARDCKEGHAFLKRPSDEMHVVVVEAEAGKRGTNRVQRSGVEARGQVLVHVRIARGDAGEPAEAIKEEKIAR